MFKFAAKFVPVSVHLCMMVCVAMLAIEGTAKADEKGDAYDRYMEALGQLSEADDMQASLSAAYSYIAGDPRVNFVMGQDVIDLSAFISTAKNYVDSKAARDIAESRAKSAASDYDTCITYWTAYFDSGFIDYYSESCYKDYAASSKDYSDDSLLYSSGSLANTAAGFAAIEAMYDILAKY